MSVPLPWSLPVLQMCSDLSCLPPRMLHVDRRILQNAVRNVLDGELLNRYLYLSTMERSELAKKIGTTPDIVSDTPTLAPLPHLPFLSTPLPPIIHRSWTTCWRQTASRLTSNSRMPHPAVVYLPLPVLYKTQRKQFLSDERGHHV